MVRAHRPEAREHLAGEPRVRMRLAVGRRRVAGQSPLYHDGQQAGGCRRGKAGREAEPGGQ
jgi:hypothetical protein